MITKAFYTDIWIRLAFCFVIPLWSLQKDIWMDKTGFNQFFIGFVTEMFHKKSVIANKWAFVIFLYRVKLQ